MKHPKKQWNVHCKTWSRTQLQLYTNQYLQHVAKDQLKCKNVLRGGRILLQCSCLATHLTDAGVRADVTRYLLAFLHQSRKEQTMILTQRIQQSKRLFLHNNHINCTDKEHCRFTMPGHENIMVCSSAVLTLLGFSRHVWAHCLQCATDCKHVDDKIMPVHGGKNSNSGNALTDTIATALETFFQQQQQLAAAAAACADDDNDKTNQHSTPTTIILKTTMTKKGLYERFCHERGWVLVKTVEGNVKPEPSSTTQQQEPICSLSSFLAYWKKNFPQLDVPFSISRRGCEVVSPSVQSVQDVSPLQKSSVSLKKAQEEDTATGKTASKIMTTPRRSSAETANLLTSPRTLSTTTPAATMTASLTTTGPDCVKPTTNENSHQHVVVKEQPFVQSSDYQMQRELQQCREQLSWEKEANRRLQMCLRKKESEVMNLEAENKHLHAAIALFRVNHLLLPPPSTKTTKVSSSTGSTMHVGSLKRKYVPVPSPTEVYVEQRDQHQDERDDVNVETSFSKRLRA